MLKGQQNESLYDKIVTVTERFFTKRTLAGELFVNKCYSELHENLSFCLFADVRRQTH